MIEASPRRMTRSFAPLLAACLASACSADQPDQDREDAWPEVDASTETAPHGRAFYVRADGDDGASGLSAEEAWRSTERANRQDLEPGDTLLFEGGARFEGTLRLEAADSGSAQAPVRVGSHGEGRAQLYGGAGDGIAIRDAEGVIVENLIVLGDWDAERQAGNGGEGVSATGTVSGTRRRYLRLRELTVSGFKSAGIALHARPSDESKNSGYEDVEISDCVVHDNGDFGVLSDGPYRYDRRGYSHASLQVRRVRAHHNRGLRGKGQHTGSGIVLSDVEIALIEHSLAHDNGELNDHDGGGGFGIWAWDADRVLIQRNESYDNRSKTADGGGFDLDGGVTRSVLRYNYSHGNQGAGLGAFQFSYARPYSGNRIEYNISQGDGFGVLVWDGNGDMGSLAVANNVTYGDKPMLVTYSPLAEVQLVGNIFYGVGPTLLDVFEGGPGLTLQGNDYWTADAPFQIAWDTGAAEPASYSTFEAYRSATGQETRAGVATGYNLDPQLMAPGEGPTLNDTTRLPELSMYQLRSDSPLVDRGVLPDELEPARFDFFGRPRPQGAAPDIGAHELR
jgi:hypothetical protein